LPAAAANPFDEAHSSRFAFFEVKDFVKATKPHIKNPGALASVIWRSDVEDEAIERWKAEHEERRQLQERLNESETEIASNFSMDAWIGDLIANFRPFDAT